MAIFSRDNIEFGILQTKISKLEFIRTIAVITALLAPTICTAVADYSTV